MESGPVIILLDLSCCFHSAFMSISSAKTNAFNKNIPQYSNSFTIHFNHPTAFTPEIVKHALEGLRAMYKDGYRYKKAGIYLRKLSPQSSIQPDLFGEFSLTEHYKQPRLMAIVDAINKIHGRDTRIFAIQGRARSWKMHQFKLSSHFTTSWSELLTIS